MCDHVPEEIVECGACGGEGCIPRTIYVYENGCGFSHPDVVEDRCEACGGVGWFLREAEGDKDGDGHEPCYEPH